ncbi:hypothetical protein SCLCIDRAFT_273525 [Scleroderma citrinum Foug A]|uniref:Uncharacterized protein n=1 Tax=Scleroderma citrinum Foug A TaxID=1036808 RepID=A0A0C3DIY5_9AGAM|nr:hypothetical protein SCLCIDRAFT_273525 [Scleroderma citrinum Foug A]
MCPVCGLDFVHPTPVIFFTLVSAWRRLILSTAMWPQSFPLEFCHGPCPLDHSRATFGGCNRDHCAALFLHRGYRWALGYILVHALVLSLILPPSPVLLLRSPLPTPNYNKFGKGCMSTFIYALGDIQRGEQPTHR